MERIYLTRYTQRVTLTMSIKNASGLLMESGLLIATGRDKLKPRSTFMEKISEKLTTQLDP